MGIPISFLGTFLFMPAFDISLNMVSMFAFLIALGIVVDDAIVVGENIYHNHQDGMPFLDAAIKGADVFIGVSAPGILSREQVESMSDKPIVFALSNPTPEIRPELIADIAGIIATGRSDYPNQINNVLAFPGVFRGALDAGAESVTENMKVAAAEAIAARLLAEGFAEEDIHVIGPTADRGNLVVRIAAATRAANPSYCLHIWTL